MPVKVTRRRFLSVVGASAGLAALAAARLTAAPQRIRWTGTAMGAQASITLYHSDPIAAQALIAACVAEISRVEGLFSLFRRDSVLVRLNRDGRVDGAPPDFIDLVRRARAVSEISDGAFDVTVQPLWDLYAGHFAKPGADPNGPADAAIAAATSRIDYRKVAFDTSRIELPKGMGITLDGIARGYATDKVTALLRSRGMTNVLVQLDKAGAIGPHADGQPWRIGIADPKSPDKSLGEIALVDKAVGSSGGYGTVFDPAGRFTHLFVPSTGRSAHYNAQVTVVTETALAADALSTTLSVVPRDKAPAIMKATGGATAYFVDYDNKITRLTA